jgi:hypothetical protein
MHRLVLPRPATCGLIYSVIQSYVVKHYGFTYTVVFDGYSCTKTTKCVEHIRRSNQASSHDLQFDDTMNINCMQQQFLGNSKNKMLFISALRTYLEVSEIKDHQADGDADRMIVDTAMNIAAIKSRVAIVGEDTDILIMLIAHALPEHDLYLLKPGTGQNSNKVYSAQKLQMVLGDMYQHLPFLQAATQHPQFSDRRKKGHFNFSCMMPFFAIVCLYSTIRTKLLTT